MGDGSSVHRLPIGIFEAFFKLTQDIENTGPPPSPARQAFGVAVRILSAQMPVDATDDGSLPLFRIQFLVRSVFGRPQLAFYAIIGIAMSQHLTLYHGSKATNLLPISSSRTMRPDSSGRIFFSEIFDDALQHGADLQFHASFAVKLDVTIPVNAKVERKALHGNPRAVIVVTTAPIPVSILELYVRAGRVGSFRVQTINGFDRIRAFLETIIFTGDVAAGLKRLNIIPA